MSKQLTENINVYIKEKHNQDECIGFIAGFKASENIKPLDPYANDLNTKRIKAYKLLAEMYNVHESTVRDIFCKGIDWYIEQVQKEQEGKMLEYKELDNKF